MTRKRKTYTGFQLVSAVFMILALLWLTISAPFVVACQQEIAKQEKMSRTGSMPAAANEEEAANPFGNTTEEKAPSSSSFSEEYLHDHPVTAHFFQYRSQYHVTHNIGTYNAFHGEVHVPPPNVA